jgi:hypothetical protein
LDQEQYVAQLRMSGSEQLVRAWLDGDWNAIESGFFANEWSDKVIIPPFVVPQHWPRLRSMDWGFSTPFAVYWAAVASDDTPHDNRIIPRGSLVVYREWYGSPAGQLTTGLRMTAPEIANGIIAREAGERIGRAVLDPSAFNAAGGPSYAEQMNTVLMKQQRPLFIPGDNRRVAKLGAISGWSQMRERLRSGGLLLFDTCVSAIETIPTLQHDPDNPEDLLKCPTDHCADALRYLCMARPWAGNTEEEVHQREQDIRRSMPPEPKEFILVAQPDGSLKANYTMWHFINRKQRERKARGYRR